MLRSGHNLRMYARFMTGLPRHLRRRDTLEGGRALLAERLANRESNFVRVAERAIFGHPGSPYLHLLREARCEFEDLRSKVMQDGLENALRFFQQAGIFVTFEQFKGREPLRCGGKEIAVSTDDFNNPFLKRHFETQTSGSTGPRTRNPIDLDHKAARSPISLAVRDAQGFLDLPQVRVKGMLPQAPGFAGALGGASRSNPPKRWFVPTLDPPRKAELRFRLAHHYVMAMARLHGIQVPRPEPLRMTEVVKVAQWAAETLETESECIVHCTPSMALRICLAARSAGIDLTGTIFRCGGEPLTEAKMAGIAATGARAYCNYSMSEAGQVGAACLRPYGVNDQHLMKDHLGVIQAPRQVHSTEVDALLLTTLLPTAPRILFNVEIDDYGVIEERSCGCPLEALGLTTHVRDVRSFKKLTAEGVTLVGSEMESVLEHELPERFGGSALDYQLVEEEDERGLTRVCLNVSPSVQLADDAQIIEAVRSGLERSSIAGDIVSRFWNQADAIRVRRVEPVLGVTGKLLPLRSDRRVASAPTRQESRG